MSQSKKRKRKGKNSFGILYVCVQCAVHPHPQLARTKNEGRTSRRARGISFNINLRYLRREQGGTKVNDRTVERGNPWVQMCERRGKCEWIVDEWFEERRLHYHRRRWGMWGDVMVMMMGHGRFAMYLCLSSIRARPDAVGVRECAQSTVRRACDLVPC